MSALFALPSLARAPISRPIASTICAQCRRSFHANVVAYAGHNKWSKIKHEKGAADKKKAGQRTQFAKFLTLYSKLYGPDPNMNASLANTIASAKKSGMPKDRIDVAIARGQGKSTSGEGLESLMLEVLAPGGVALIVDAETDKKQRALKDLRDVVKQRAGTVAPTAFLFARRGRTVLRSPPSAASSGKGQEEEVDEDLMMRALEAGAEDVEPDPSADGQTVIWSPANLTHQVAQAEIAPGAEVVSSEIIWSCASDRVAVDDAEAAEELRVLLASLRAYEDVTAIYSNAEQGESLSDEAWSAIEEHLDF
ncbi:YebC-like protein [Xylariomycetidae sp. FL0641]|nr:YebC-like protein [Xylariomycetidae sp. FL0641]